MDQNFQTTKPPTATSITPSSAGINWLNPNRILTDDSSSSTLAYISGGDQGASIAGTTFGFALPPGAVIDGIEVHIDGSQVGLYGSVGIGVTGIVAKDIGALNGVYGGPTDLWGLDEITVADLATITGWVFTGDVSGGDGIGSIDFMEMTVFWHIELVGAPADVPTRFAYKVWSRDGNYLGELPGVTSKFGFPQDMNSVGSSISVTCGVSAKNEVTVSPLLTEGGDPIETEDGRVITDTITNLLVAQGSSPDEAIFKNSNRVQVWMYNYFYPNGKKMFTGVMRRVGLAYGGDNQVKLTIYSDSLDLNRLIARGFPFAYSTDVSQTSQNGFATCSADRYGGWVRYGQTWVTGASVTNIGAIQLWLQGTADVTLSVYDAPNGNLIGSVTRSVANGSAAAVQFEFPSLIPVASSTSYFWAISVGKGQSINVYRSSTDVYANGTRYESIYSGGSGGGLYSNIAGDFYFITKAGTPTTTTTFTTDDPVTEMAHNALLDYNARGGSIKERDFQATGLSLTYTFVMATLYALITKVLELSPTGYYSYIDMGTNEIDILPVSQTADFTVTKGRHINQLNLDMTIEQVQNYLLLTGGESSPGVNLYRDYLDAESVAFYGISTATKSDNRVTQTATADAIGDTFIEENSDETQETTLIVLNDQMDITLLTPGKTIGFRNFGNFIDDLVLPIARRELNMSDGMVTLTLGRLPVRMNDQVQKINRELFNEQTINNPTAPS